jgi:hemerythrin
MLAASLPDRENHIRVHKDFYYQLKLLILQCHSGVKSAFNGLPQFVSDWNINHITNFDLAYKGHVKSDHTQSKKVIWPTQTDELLNKSGLGLPEFKN